MLTTPNKSIAHLHEVWIIGISIVLAIPVLINGCIDGHDIHHHLIWSTYFSQQFWQGDLYPRWIQAMNGDLGSPTFFFYPPATYYINSLFSPLFHSLSGCHVLSISSLAALMASGLTAYLWLKEIASKTAAAIASILYMAWPYHLAIDLYMRFALAEYWSFVWMPLILYFSTMMIKGKKIGGIGFAVSLALLAFTHLPIFTIFFPVPVAYIVVMARSNQRVMISLRLVFALALALGLSAIFWVPAMTTQDMVSMAAMSIDRFVYFNNFLFTGPDFWSCLELTTVLMVGLAFCNWRLAVQSLEPEVRRESHYWMIVTMLVLLMTLPFSKFIWDWLPVVQKIQFPWRFDAVLTVTVSALVALSRPQAQIRFIQELIKSDRLNFSGRKYSFLKIGSLLGLIVILTIMHIFPVQKIIVFQNVFQKLQYSELWLFLIALTLLSISFLRTPLNFSKQKFASSSVLLTLVIFTGSLAYNPDFFSRLDPSTVDGYIELAMAPDEHRPRWVPEALFDRSALSALSHETPTVQLNDGQADWRVEQWRPRTIMLQVDAITAAELTLHQFYYPEWTVRLDGRSPAQPTHPSDQGLLQISVPAGHHQVFVTLDAGRQERLGQLISGVSLVMLLLSIVGLGLPRRKDSLRHFF